MKQSPLITDLYQLMMMQAYFLGKNNGPAVFECYIRNQAASRNFYLAMGQSDVLNYLQALAFDESELAYLADTNLFQTEFLTYLQDFRFTGDVWAMSEGEVAFANEPMLRIEAPIMQAQLVESCIINLMHYQTLIASKAVRCTLQAHDKQLFDFGLRRAHGEDAALMAARSSYAAGFAGSATVKAGKQYNLPIIGTMAHAFILAYPDEYSAFLAFAQAHPERIILLIDTYDTMAGVENVIKLAKSTDYKIKGVRIDSGDLGVLAAAVRKRLDEAELKDIKIYVSGNVDEYKIAKLTQENAPIDGYGVGTRMVTSEDCPSLDMVYKLQQFENRNTMKFSPGKVSLPGVKQVFREYDENKVIAQDTLGLASENLPGTALLKQVMQSGDIISKQESLENIRDKISNSLQQIPEHMKGLNTSSFTAVHSDKLQALID